jgi:FAD dependent oxidoreductase TIGR03364
LPGKAFDLVVVGAGIVGLAHALAANRRGLRVAVVDREERAVGASVRNFGFVTVTGQQAGQCWKRAMRSRNVWLEVAPQAGIAVEAEGLFVVAQRPAAMAVLEAFAATGMGQGCTLLDAGEAQRRFGDVLAAGPLAGGLWSPHEVRVESRNAVPRLAGWLEGHGVTFFRKTLATSVADGRVETTAGRLSAERIVVCPGDDLLTLFPERIAALKITRCQLQMMKVAPADPAFRLACAIMSDLSLVRYLGYAELPEAAALKARLEAEQPEHLRHGIHLIAVPGQDGLIVGDSHHYGFSASPFGREDVDALILDELKAVLRLPRAAVIERWIGTYASLPDRLAVTDAPLPSVRLVIVTSGTGASTAFGIAEETINDLYGAP